MSASGATLSQDYPNEWNGFGENIHYDPGTGYIYSDGGTVVNPATGAQVGTFAASGIAVPDSTLNRVFFVGQVQGQVGTASYTLESFDQTKFTPIGSITISGVVGTPTALIRWGSSGLAMVTKSGNLGGNAGPGQLYLLSGTFVNPAQALRPQPYSPRKRTCTGPGKLP